MNNNFVGQMPMQPVPQSQNLPQGQLLNNVVLVPDIHTVSVVRDFTAGSDRLDRIGIAVQQADLIEERQVFRADRDLQGVFPGYLHTGQVRSVPRCVVAPAGQVIRLFGRTADLADQGRGAQQPAERVVPGGDLRAVGIIQVIIQRQAVDMVPGIIPGDQASEGDHGRIQLEAADRGIPFDQVISVDQLPDVHVAGGVTPVVHGERPVRQKSYLYPACASSAPGFPSANAAERSIVSISRIASILFILSLLSCLFVSGSAFFCLYYTLFPVLFNLRRNRPEIPRRTDCAVRRVFSSDYS